MESRTLKYMSTGTNESTATRSSRNSRLYREVYGKYGELDNLPLEDNTDEIDMARLREIMTTKQIERPSVRDYQKEEHIQDKNTYHKDEQKVYDINKLLEKAKYENNKLKDPPKKVTQANRDILSTLESNDLSLEEIKKACQKYETEKKYNEKETEESLSMTREMKYHTMRISTDPLIEQVMPDNDLSLDIFEDLKPTGNTIVTKPIKEEDINQKVENNFYSNDTSDIDVIKGNVKSTDSRVDDDFYTSSYKFSKKDFNDDEDDNFFDEKPSHNGLKIVLLLLAIIAFAFVIYYFITNYGLGA